MPCHLIPSHLLSFSHNYVRPPGVSFFSSCARARPATRAFLSPSPPHSNSNSLPISSCRLSIFLMKIESILSSSLFPRIHFRWGQGGRQPPPAAPPPGSRGLRLSFHRRRKLLPCDDPVSPAPAVHRSTKSVHYCMHNHPRRRRCSLQVVFRGGVSLLPVFWRCGVAPGQLSFRLRKEGWVRSRALIVFASAVSMS